MKNFVQKGHTVTLTALVNTNSGDFVLVGSIFGVAQIAALVGNDVEVVLGGVFDLPKKPAEAWTQGAPVYWDPANSWMTVTNGANMTKVGIATLAAANPSQTGRVRLNGSF